MKCRERDKKCETSLQNVMRRRNRPFLIASAMFLLFCSLPSGMVQADVKVLREEIELRDDIEQAEGLIRDGQLERGLSQLQAAFEKSWGAGHLVEEKRRTRPRGRKVYVAAAPYIADLLRSLAADDSSPEGEGFLSHYRSRFDPVARALFDRARQVRDTEVLTLCYELYPLTSVAIEAALLAGDIHLESYELDRAEAAWETIRWEELLRQFPGMGDDFARRWILLASLSERSALYQEWKQRWLDFTKSTDVSGLPPAPVVSTAPELPKLPFTKGEKNWETFGAFQRVSQWSQTETPFLRVPCVGSRWLALTLDRELRFYDLATGKQIDDVDFPPVRDTDPPGDVIHHDEVDPAIRLQPVAGEGYVVTTYVMRAVKKDDYMGYVITAAVPERGLMVCRDSGGRAPVWQTGKSDDEIVRELSFNCPPIIRDGKLFALGWQQVGFIDSYVVSFDLATGAVLWKTPLMSSQVDLTMFGEINSEPLMGGLLLEEGTIYALPNLGAVAAVRAWDGRPLWVTPYPVLAVEPPRQRPGTIPRKHIWSANPPVSFKDRLVIAPLDGTAAFVIFKDTGEVIRSESGLVGSSRARRSRYLVGRYGDRAVFCIGSKVHVVPAVDLDLRRSTQYTLMDRVDTRPTLVEGGLVYATAGGLFFQSLEKRDGAKAATKICGFPGPRRSRRGSAESFRHGTVTVLDRYLLVSNSYRVTCFRKATSNYEGPR